MQVRHREVFTSIKTEGAILPPDLLQRISLGDRDLDGLRPQDYHLAEGEKINEAINRSWNVLQGYWRSFQNGKEKLPDSDLGTTLTRERWLLPLFRELGYGRLLTQKAIEIENKTYPISHGWNKTPIHLVGCKVDLDRRIAGVAGAARSSPHSLTQELLNRSDDHLWAFLSNGLRLRILRDNLSLTRQAYVEFDLETMMEGEIYSDFAILWLLCHQSRVEADKPEEFWLERWSRAAQEQGTRALDQLRDGVEDAIKALGSGFLKHPLNWALREKLKAGQLDKQDYYRQILRLIYRLLFLFVAEDRNMLFDPGSRPEARELYTEYYSTTRLRIIAEKFRGTRHADLYQGFQLVSEKLGNHGCPELGLPALGSFLFSKNKALPDLENSEISNEDFLSAIRALAFTLDQGTLRAVDYKNLGSEEFGSVYESLLELHPNLNTGAGTFELDVAVGHERKTTGSYYTPSSLVQCLLDSALDPVLEEAVKEPDLEKAILDLKICDPATGSGHFLIAAAHRVARRLAAIRTGDEEPAPEATQTALRDVISHCIYGVDINPMAVELCKVALWMEALEPGKPLTFLDHKIRCGNSLLGTTPRLLEEGIPKEAFKPIEGDDPRYCAALRKRNDQERQGQLTMWASMVAESHAAYGSLSDGYQALDAMDDSSVKAVVEKEKQYDRLLQSSKYQHSKLIADAWCAAFVWPKQTEAPEPITQDIFRKIQSLDLQPIGDTVALVHELSEKFRFFHWHLAFPDVFRVPTNSERIENDETGLIGGFNVVLGNPPWEKLTLLEQEFFSKIPEIRDESRTHKRRKKIAQIEQTDPQLFKLWKGEKDKIGREQVLIRNSGIYFRTAVGELNLYPLFADLSLHIKYIKGQVGIIVKSSLLQSPTWANFSAMLIDRNLLRSAIDFRNWQGWFPDIGYHERFTLLHLGYDINQEPVKLGFYFDFASDIKSEKVFSLTINQLSKLNPLTKTIPIFESQQSKKLLLEIYDRFPILSSDESGWSVAYTTGFHTSTQSELLKTKEELEQLGGESFSNMSYFVNECEYLPLLEGKLIHQFNNRFASFERIPYKIRFGRKPTTYNPSEELLDPYYSVEPRYWVDEINVNNDFKRRQIDSSWGFAFRDTTNVISNQRTAVATICGNWCYGYKAPNFSFKHENEIKRAKMVLNFLGLFNSFAFDFVLRQKFFGANLIKSILIQLAVPKKDEVFSISNFTNPRCIELQYTNWDLAGFSQLVSYNGPPYRWEEKRRFQILCELDAAYFHLYKFNRSDVDYIMDTFPIVKKRDIEKYNEYRTKTNILAIYDKMQLKEKSGIIYKSSLSPPAADPSMQHLPKDGSRKPGSIWLLCDLLHSTPTERSIIVQIPEEYLVEGNDSTGLAKFRILKEGERMTRECQVVIIRHPQLQRGAEKVKIAAGKFYWAEQRDVETGKPFILITLRTKRIPVKLKLSLDEWKQFQPLAVLEK